MSKQAEPDAEVRPNSQETPVDSNLNNTSGKSQKSSSSKNSDRIMIFNKEE
jgi:hypothetical protein